MSSSSLFASLAAAIHSLSTHRLSVKASAPSPKSSPILLEFESDLASRIDHLKTADIGGYLSLKWLCQAMEMVLSTHSSVENFVPDLRNALSHGDVKWLDEYLDNSIKLIDICLALKETIAEIKRYCVFVKLSLRALQDGCTDAKLTRCMITLKKCVEFFRRKNDAFGQLGHRRFKLESCSSMLRRMSEKINADDASKGGFFMLIHVALVSTIFICNLLSSVLSSKSKPSTSSVCTFGQSPWCSTLISLQQKVKEQIEKKKSGGANALLQELDRTDIGVRNLYSRVEEVLRGKSLLDKKKRMLKIEESGKELQLLLIDLQQGLMPLEAHLDNVYRNLLRSRMVFLDMHTEL
ncbi:hypothetical protein KP509_03G083700 [Ceratopteris richardii]|uniref:Uncharacterized protein n=1 Tax=Ceratopteris richardii TaxID=49495 RepID=A0A8T2V9H9_CERRI|nr:hypothetical protein KP509_03G083700 [Ceratopteris richardii]